MRRRERPGFSAARGVPLLLILLLVSSVSVAVAQTVPPTGPPNPGPSCGWHGSLNGGGVVASSPPGSEVTVTVGEPSWEQDCFSFAGSGGSTSGYSFPAFEVFPIIVHAAPDETLRLEAGPAVPSAQQIAQDGVRNTTIWTWFDPGTVTTDASGAARSNLTLAGAVMPFVPNDISNVSLPITATAAGGGFGTAGLPIEFEGMAGEGVIILRSAGPIGFGSGIEGQAGSPDGPVFSVVYSPPSNVSTQAPVQVSLKVLGTYDNGKVGPMPADVQVSFPRPSFELQPYSVYYFPVSENNSLKFSSSVPAADYTFAVQETVGNSTYVEPMRLSVSLVEMIAGGTAGSVPAAANSGPNRAASQFVGSMPFALLTVAVAAGVLAVAGAVVWRRIAKGPNEALGPSQGPASK